MKYELQLKGNSQKPQKWEAHDTITCNFQMGPENHFNGTHTNVTLELELIQWGNDLVSDDL